MIRLDQQGQPMNSFTIVWATLSFFYTCIAASGIFDQFCGELTVESVRSFDFNALRPEQILVYGYFKSVPVPVIDYLLYNHLVDVNADDKKGRNSLYYSALVGDIDATRSLVRHGTTYYFGAMNVAVTKGSLEVLQVLLEHYKAQVRKREYDILLSTAALNGHVQILRTLLSTEELKKYEIYAVDSALNCASRRPSDNTQAIELLLQCGAKITVECLVEAFDFVDFAEEYTNLLYLLKSSGPDVSSLLDIRVAGSTITLRQRIALRNIPEHVLLAIDELEKHYAPIFGDEVV